MIILAVHSSSPHLGVALTRGEEVLVEQKLPPGREHLENIANLIGDVLRRGHMTLNAVDGLSVAIGPGSFSGIRIGMAAVKGIALALGKPVVGVSSLEIFAWQALKAGETGTAVIDARRSEVYVATFHRTSDTLVSLDEPSLIRAENLGDYARRFAQPLVLAGDEVVDGLAAASAHIARSMPLVPSPVACAQRAGERFAGGEVLSVHALLPLYIRRSDAEERRSALPS
ncbi:MAG: tRNA (adenosine(37)-N6)-threonylcarbamoyltransferase complex dimerization subunit type 1 TsaB [Desulfomonile tiedjei]|nr:tRNA (adenosine(37)-N6)-threonylcarbamoyltransferase complex dimerization subunit type 1 TsaB [Desulfomonile tiedjei]